MPANSLLEERVPPFRQLPAGEQVILAVAIAAGEVGTRIDAVLRTRSPVLSHTRFNALRILRGAGAGGLSCGQIGARLLLAPSDVTRLLGPLIDRGWVRRAGSADDRRIVLHTLTVKGQRLVAQLDSELAPIYAAVERGFGRDACDRLVAGSERLIALARSLDHSDAPERRTLSRVMA